MNILEFLKQNKNTRKIFGERELKIIDKQLNGINLTQSEKNRLSRDIRPKFNFIEKAIIFEDQFKLKKAALIKEKIKYTKQIILEDKLYKKIKRIILYGSAVENKLTFRSDIDIAIEFDKITKKEATLFRARIMGKIDSRIDIQVYNHLPSKIKKGVDKGKIL